MKNTFYTIIWIIFFTKSKIALADQWGILWEFSWDETNEKLRSWNITTEDIPKMLTNMIDFGINIAWTIAIIFIIIWAYKLLFGAIEQDKSKWKNTIIMAIWGFVIASLAWFIIRLILDNFS